MKGRFKFWHADRGFGFIEPEEGGEDVFLHESEVPVQCQPLLPGSVVDFDLTLGKNGRPQARVISVLQIGAPEGPREDPAARKPAGKRREPLWETADRSKLAGETVAALMSIAKNDEADPSHQIDAARLILEALNEDAQT